MKNPISDFTQAAIELALREQTMKRGEESALASTSVALQNWKRAEARERFEILLAWNQLREFAHDWKEALSSQPLTFIVDAWFLQDLIQYLTPGKDEEIAYVTGISIGKIKILSRICGVKLEKQSVVYARATAKSCAETLAEIIDKGSALHVMAHSHPGRGAGATHESGIDVNYLGRIQRAGADVVGIIVTRDGFVRFFSVEKKFRVLVQGIGVKQIEENVFQITSP